MSMDRLFGKIKQLPTIPQLLHELMQSFNDENARIDEIAAKIAMDQVISVKVLRMANSAALRRGNEVTSIEQAVIRLGFNRLRSVVVASGIISSFKAPPGFDKHRFWTQTFQVATIARTLAQQTKAVDPESAFTCALIHNIGELLIRAPCRRRPGSSTWPSRRGAAGSRPSGRCWDTTMPSSVPNWHGAGTCRKPSSMPSPSSWIPSPMIRSARRRC